MRRFGADQMSFNFSPQGPSHRPSFYPPPPRAPYSHIQIVPNAKVPRHPDPASSSPLIFRKPSYSEEAENSMATAAPVPLPPKPAASLANMTSGTTFAAKARAAELNAVRARRAMKDLNDADENPSSIPTAPSGPVKLNKPRSRGKGWKPLNLDEIPESTTEADQPAYHHQSTIPASIEHHHPHPAHYPPDAPLTATRHYTTEMPTQSAYVTHEHVKQQLSQFNPLTLQQQPHYDNSAAQNLPSQYHAPLRRSPESMLLQHKLTEDDPFMDMPQTAFRLPMHGFDHQSQSVADTALRSINNTTPAVAGAMDYDFKFPQEHDDRRNIPHPPGLPVPSGHTTKPRDDENTSSPHRQPAPTADIHQRDPKPYTSFTRSSDDNSRREKILQDLHQAMDRSKARGDVPSSTRTVLYDPVAQDPNTSAIAHGPAVSLSGDDILTTSEPLPWKDRRVDIYNMVPPGFTGPRFIGGERPVAASAQPAEFGGNAYIRSLVEQPSWADERQQGTEAWWYHDGRGQEHVRAYLEQVAEQHRIKKSGQDYQSIKKSLERQANFRDDWSDSSHNATIPETANAAEAFDRLIGPVVANLRSYAEDIGPSYFNTFTKAPAWAIDGSVEGNKSFFGEDWGKPPSRVGRDPRYRPTFHEGRYTVFEPTDGRVSGRGW